MDTNTKYSVGDILTLNENENYKRVILFISNSFYDETGLSKKVYYFTKQIDTDMYPPCPMKESSIDKYYTIWD